MKFSMVTEMMMPDSANSLGDDEEEDTFSTSMACEEDDTCTWTSAIKMREKQKTIFRLIVLDGRDVIFFQK